MAMLHEEITQKSLRLALRWLVSSVQDIWNLFTKTRSASHFNKKIFRSGLNNSSV